MNKTSLVALLKSKLNEKIKHFETLITETRASNTDTKSSMGDKYETGREMLQQEINQLQRQLNEVSLQRDAVQKLNDVPNSNVDFGALVQTDLGYFYLSTSIGEFEYQQKKIFAISLESPLAKSMLNKKVGEQFIINSKMQTIKNIW